MKTEATDAMVQKYGVPVPPLCVKYVLNLGTVALPRTSHPEHMQDNSNLDFENLGEDMETLKALDFKDYGKYSYFPVFSGKKTPYRNGGTAMKKGIVTFLGLLLCFGLTACAGQQVTPPVSEEDSYQEQSDIQNSNDISATQSRQNQKPESSHDNSEASETGEKKVKLIIGSQELSVTLYDTPAANALYDMLPLDLTFEDFNGIEKIAYMDCELPTEGEPDGCDPSEGDFCLYAPWGNLSIFYQDFRYSDSLIKLGHIDSGMEMISSMNEDFSATLETTE